MIWIWTNDKFNYNIYRNISHRNKYKIRNCKNSNKIITNTINNNNNNKYNNNNNTQPSTCPRKWHA